MKTTILIVVKHDILRETLARWLRWTFPKCHVRAVSNESEAIALALTNLPTVIVIDAGLPETKGFDAIKRIKNVLPTIPILLLTVFQTEIRRSHAIDCGATVCFRKDARLTELQSTVSTLLAPSADTGGGQVIW
jgi:DNA-binding NarL/FixJ family response regulator